MAVTRLNDAFSWAVDKDGVQVATDQYLVDNTSAVVAPLSLVGVPHPDLGLAFRGIQSSVQRGPHAIVTVQYGNSNGGSGPDDLDENFQSSSFTNRQVTTDYPEMEKVTQDFDDGAGGIVQRSFWDYTKRSPLSVTAEHPVHTYRTTFEWTWASVSAASSAIQQFQLMSGSLHVISGKAYKFEFRVINQETPVRWRVEYSWVRDLGIPLLIPDAADRTPFSGWTDFNNPNQADFVKVVPLFVNNNPIYGEVGQRFIRLPYHDIDVAPYVPPTGPPDPGALPVCTPVLRHDDSNPTGWQLLPGVTP